MPDEAALQRIKDREILDEPWHFTDDTVMAIGIYRILAAHSILRGIGEGKDWREAASEAFDGMGSMVVSLLGNGMGLTAQDTVPFCFWCAAYYYTSVEEALWTAVSALGDRDTICAIVGGMVSLFADELPQKWLGYMEHPEDSEFIK